MTISPVLSSNANPNLQVHLAYKPLHCGYCSFKHFAMSKVRRHTARVHPKRPVKVSYHPVPDVGKRIKEMKAKCFGALASSTSWPEQPRSSSRVSNQEPAKPDSPAAVDSPDSGAPQIFSPPLKGSGSGNGLFPGLGGIFPGMPGGTGGQFVEPTAAPMSGAAPDELMDGQGKKSCALCKSLIANSPNAIENHVCKHLDYRPYHCQYCDYQSYIRGKVSRHIQQVRAALSVASN